MKRLLLLLIFCNAYHIVFAQTITQKETLYTNEKKISHSNNWYENFTNWLDYQPPISEKKIVERKKEETNDHQYTMKIIRPVLEEYPILIKPIDTTKTYFIRNLFDSEVTKKEEIK